MSLTLTDVRRIAADVATQQNPAVEVFGATPAEGESTYAEVIVAIHGCRVEPCRLIIGVSRDASEVDCRRTIQQHLLQHLVRHR